MSIRNQKFIYIDFDEIVKNDIVWGLLELGVNLSRTSGKVRMHDGTEEDVLEVLHAIESFDVVFSQNFSCTVAEACHRIKKIYISWVYDCPQRALYTKEALYDTNRIFMFDKAGINDLKNFGVKNIYYMPLAANITQASSVVITDEDIEKYGADVAFVGSMYDRPEIKKVIDDMPEITRCNFEEDISHVFMKWGEKICLNKSLSSESIQYLCNHFDFSGLEKYQMEKRYLMEIAFAAPVIAERERTRLLNIAAEKYNTALYTGGLPQLKASVRPRVNYEDEMYKVFFSSKINLNITYRGIQTGAPQRIFDIMSVGGFCLSNYQAELTELFEENKEIVLFYDEYDFKNKLDYYLSHDRERITIGINGYKKVSEHYSYVVMLGKIFDIIDGEN